MKVLPCPFCGGPAERNMAFPSHEKPYSRYWYRCIECASCSDEYRDSGEALTAWNRREKEVKK